MSVVTFLADSAPSWTDKEILSTIGATVAVMVSICLFLISHTTKSARRRLKEETRLRKEAERRFTDSQMVIDAIPEDYANAQVELSCAIADVQKLQTDLQSTQGEKQSMQAAAGKLERELTTTKTTLEKRHGELVFFQKRIYQAISSKGPVWSDKQRWPVPEYRPLDGDARRMPIISVLNLKGGVGKTTIAGNLGACLHGRGYRTLLLDLDLQGSLTNLYLSDDAQDVAFQNRTLVGEFLNRSFDADIPNLLDYRHTILGHPGSGIVPTADDLAYTEMNLAVRWLLRAGRRDPRFLLRRELHRPRITDSNDVVLIDCPPLMNVFCVNAIAASDYVIIPIVPTNQSIVRVPVLLQLLTELRTNVNPHIKVLGIVCNRSFRDKATTDELSRFDDLRKTCKDIWGEDVKQFASMIKQSVDIRTVEDERRPLGLGDTMFQPFARLTDEVISRLPTFCQPKSAESLVEEEEEVPA